MLFTGPWKCFKSSNHPNWNLFHPKNVLNIRVVINIFQLHTNCELYLKLNPHIKICIANLPLAATVLLKSDIFPGTDEAGALTQMLLNGCLSLFSYWDFTATHAKKVQRMQGVWGIQGGHLRFSSYRWFCPNTQGWEPLYKPLLKQHIADVTNYVIFQQAVR